MNECDTNLSCLFSKRVPCHKKLSKFLRRWTSPTAKPTPTLTSTSSWPTVTRFLKKLAATRWLMGFYPSQSLSLSLTHSLSLTLSASINVSFWWIFVATEQDLVPRFLFLVSKLFLKLSWMRLSLKIREWWGASIDSLALPSEKFDEEIKVMGLNLGFARRHQHLFRSLVWQWWWWRQLKWCDDCSRVMLVLVAHGVALIEVAKKLYFEKKLKISTKSSFYPNL